MGVRGNSGPEEPGKPVRNRRKDNEMKPLSLEEQVRRRNELNAKNYPSERWMERLLKSCEVGEWRRNICLEGRYFGDFVWRSARVVIEVDGAVHAGKADYDQRRDKFLSSRGWRIFRIVAYDEKGALCLLGSLKDVMSKKTSEQTKKRYGKMMGRMRNRIERIEFFKAVKASQEQGHAKAWLEAKKAGSLDRQ